MQTIDFFTPVVDDPFTFGQIAAANALSDVYAMGGRPLTCLNLAGFPIDRLPLEVLAEILKGGAERVSAAGATLVGGHTIDDTEPKYGLAVTGVVHPNRVLSNASAQPGDRIILTKPLGIGIITTAMKRTTVPVEMVEDAVDAMVTLNDIAAQVALEFGAHACTDVTGFGFLGHLHEMALGSGVTIEVWADRVPVIPGTHALVTDGYVCGGSKANRRYAARYTSYEDIPEDLQIIYSDAITSGGLLLAVPAHRAEAATAALHQQGVSAASIVGTVMTGEAGRLIVR